jgi:hypothetical protein
MMFCGTEMRVSVWCTYFNSGRVFSLFLLLFNLDTKASDGKNFMAKVDKKIAAGSWMCQVECLGSEK